MPFEINFCFYSFTNIFSPYALNKMRIIFLRGTLHIYSQTQLAASLCVFVISSSFVLWLRRNIDRKCLKTESSFSDQPITSSPESSSYLLPVVREVVLGVLSVHMSYFYLLLLLFFFFIKLLLTVFCPKMTRRTSFAVFFFFFLDWLAASDACLSHLMAFLQYFKSCCLNWCSRTDSSCCGCSRVAHPVEINSKRKTTTGYTLL